MPAASLSRTSSFPSLRRPVSAARTLCTCQPVALVRSSSAAPSGRSRRATIAAFFDRLAGVAGERTFGTRNDAALAGRFGADDLADLWSALRAGLPVCVLRDLGMN